MKKKNIIISVIGIAIIIAVVLIVVIVISGNGNKGKKKIAGLTKDNLLTLSLESRNKDYSEEDILVEIDFVEKMLKTGTRREFMNYEDAMPKELVLTDEQCDELKEYIVDYSHKIKEKEDEYWPKTDEYPEMFVLFEYDITFGDSENYKEYSADGALCYPDGWSEFIKTLMEY